VKWPTALIVLALSTAPSALVATEESRASHRSFQLPEMVSLNLPFSDAVLVDNTLYISGTGGLNLSTMSVPDDPREEVKRMMENIVRILAMADMTVTDLVSVTVYCTDLSLYGAFNEIYRGYFKSGFPARAFIGSGPLLFGMRFEIQAIAIRQMPRKVPAPRETDD